MNDGKSCQPIYCLVQPENVDISEGKDAHLTSWSVCLYVSIRSAGGICFRGKKERDNDLSGRGTILSLFPARQDRDGLLGRSEYFGSNDEMTIKGTTKLHFRIRRQDLHSNLHPEDAFRSARGYPRLGVGRGPRQRAKKSRSRSAGSFRSLSHSIVGKFDCEVRRCVAIPSSFPF